MALSDKNAPGLLRRMHVMHQIQGVLLMFALPEDFIQFLRDAYGTEAANAWFQRLPSLLEECAERWQLKLLPPFENLSFHYVAPAERSDGTSVILKTCQLSDEFAQGLAALRIFDGRGIARLLECDEEQEAMLLERLQPGTMLASLVPDRMSKPHPFWPGSRVNSGDRHPQSTPFRRLSNWGKD